MQNLHKFTSIDEMKMYAADFHLSLVCYKNIVYDISQFQFEHPGGLKVIAPHINERIDNIIFNPKYNKHDPSIIMKLEPYKFGFIAKSKECDKEFKSITPKNSGIKRARDFLFHWAETEKSSSIHVEERNHQQDPIVPRDDFTIQSLPTLNYNVNRSYFSQKKINF